MVEVSFTHSLTSSVLDFGKYEKRVIVSNPYLHPSQGDIMIVLGRNARYGDPDYSTAHVQDVLLSPDARKQGTYVIGTTGTGKSTLLVNMIMQDIRAGEGVCLLDPHGDITTDILHRVPRGRRDDVILFDPADLEYPFGLNLLECGDDPREKDLVTSTLIETLYKLFEYSWGPRMEDLLRNSILSLLYHNEPTTLVHLMMVLVNYEHRQRLTARARAADPVLKMYWEDEFPESIPRAGGYTKTKDQRELVASSLNKIGRFITNPVIRNIVGQPKSTVKLRDVMDDGKILLVNLSKGDLGSDNSSLLGAVLVNQLLIAALSRRDTPEKKRRPFHLYVDEYQNFATKTFPQLQSEARKYGIDTTVAHQFRDQLDDENQGSTLNVANIICLRVSGRDSIEIAQQFDLTPPEAEPRFEPIVEPVAENVFVNISSPGTGTGLYRMVARDSQAYSDVHLETANLLAQLKNHTAICRVLTAKERPRTLHQFRIILDDKPLVGESHADYIRDRSRQLCTYTREQVIKLISEYTSFDAGDEISIFSME